MSSYKCRFIRELVFEREAIAYKRLMCDPLRFVSTKSRREKRLNSHIDSDLQMQSNLILKIIMRAKQKIALCKSEVYFQGMRDYFQFIIRMGILAD